jgi:hypothetical protein
LEGLWVGQVYAGRTHWTAASTGFPLVALATFKASLSEGSDSLDSGFAYRRNSALSCLNPSPAESIFLTQSAQRSPLGVRYSLSKAPQLGHGIRYFGCIADFSRI